MGFNNFCFLNNPKIKYVDDVTYTWCYNASSITRKNDYAYSFSGLEEFCDNIVWAVEQNKKADQKLLSIVIYKNLLKLYYYYLNYEGEDNSEKLLIWFKKLVSHYRDYANNLSLEEEKEIEEEVDAALVGKIDLSRFIWQKYTFDEFIKKVEEFTDD